MPGYATLHRYGNLIGEQYDLRNLSHMLDGTEVSGEEALAAYCPEVGYPFAVIATILLHLWP